MTGWSGAYVCSSARLAPPVRPARPVTWLRSWNVRSAARRSPWASPRSASTTPTSLSKGKLCPLATSCVPMMMSTSPLAIEASSSRSRSMPPARSLDRTIVRACREARRDLLRQPLDAGADGHQALGVAAAGAGFRPLLRMAAMVAEQHAAEAVLDQPGRAVGALEAVAAGAAERQRRIAAPVEEQQRLFVPLERLGDRLDQRRRQEAAALRLVVAQVDRLDRPAAAPPCSGR